MLNQLWNDEGGAVVSPELCIVGAILVVGLIVGVSSVQTAITTEIEDVGDAIESFDFTPTLEPISPGPLQDQDNGNAPLTAADLINQ